MYEFVSRLRWRVRATRLSALFLVSMLLALPDAEAEPARVLTWAARLPRSSMRWRRGRASSPPTSAAPPGPQRRVRCREEVRLLPHADDRTAARAVTRSGPGERARRPSRCAQSDRRGRRARRARPRCAEHKRHHRQDRDHCRSAEPRRGRQGPRGARRFQPRRCPSPVADACFVTRRRLPAERGPAGPHGGGQGHRGRCTDWAARRPQPSPIIPVTPRCRPKRSRDTHRNSCSCRHAR